MKRIITNALLGTFVALTAGILGACGSASEETHTCLEWMELSSRGNQLTDKDSDTVDNACWYSTLPLEEPVTMDEMRILEADYFADMECAFDINRFDTPECVARLDHDLTIEEVRKGLTK